LAQAGAEVDVRGRGRPLWNYSYRSTTRYYLYGTTTSIIIFADQPDMAPHNGVESNNSMGETKKKN
jgi:hypothetical protein